MRGVCANKPVVHAASVGARAAWLENANAGMELCVVIQGVQAGKPSQAKSAASAGADATRLRK